MKLILSIFLLLSFDWTNEAVPVQSKQKRSLYVQNTAAFAEQAKQEKGTEYWNTQAKNTLDKILNQTPIHKAAKNIIFFLGDGMSIPTITAARIHKAQYKHGLRGEDYQLEFEKFPYVALSKTYNIDKQVPDSAATATAFLCGVKANYGTIGLNGKVNRSDCAASLDRSTHLSSILQWAQEAGKDTGFVTTTRVTHATPAGLYAQVADREWESDRNKTETAQECEDIAHQLVYKEPGSKTKVILGGGFRNFYPISMTEKNGFRLDGLNLINYWKTNRNKVNDRKTYVENREDLLKVKADDVDYLLGLFNEDHLTYEVDKDEKIKQQEPTLIEMTEKAIEILQKSENGFFLLVEGGRIDMAHHAGFAKKALREVVFFDDAIQKAIEMTDERETLIVVTADHAHVMTINGYPSRGNDILGLVLNSTEDPLPGYDYSTLMYTNGPGFRLPTPEKLNSIDISAFDSTDDNFHQLAAVPKAYETHGGDDVAIFARGPMAHIFQGVVEQNYIAHAMAYASCLRGYDDLCSEGYSKGSTDNPLQTCAPVAPSECEPSPPNSGSTLSLKVSLLLPVIVLFHLQRIVL